jgi:ribosomal RNA assembly protein
MIESVNVPKDRINVIKDDKAKRGIENSINVKLSFDENTVIIDGEGLDLFTAKNIIKAIGRGFAPDKAFRLLDEEQVLEVIEIGEESNNLKTIKSRLIGTKGKTRRMIEEFSGASLSIYGKTVSFIGKYEQLKISKDAVNMLMKGSKHAKVYKFLFDVNQDETGETSV